MAEKPLGLRLPTDDKHKKLFPLRTAAENFIPDKPTPGIAGTFWYTDFDNPVWDAKGRFWIVGKDHTNLGRIRGGHCYCFKPNGVWDTAGWYQFYDQGTEGACVGFGIARAKSLLDRVRFDARRVYRDAQLIDEWGDTPPEEGTSVRAGLDIVRTQGMPRIRGRLAYDYSMKYTIMANRWAETVDEFIAAMHSPRYLELGRAPFMNSWGTDYPKLTWMPLETIDLLLRQDGEMAIIVDS